MRRAQNRDIHVLEQHPLSQNGYSSPPFFAPGYRNFRMHLVPGRGERVKIIDLDTLKKKKKSQKESESFSLF